jgi:hypothetical protein
MSKLLALMALTFSLVQLAPAAQAETLSLHCMASGSTYGIKMIVAFPEEMSDLTDVRVTYANGTTSRFFHDGNLDKSFQVMETQDTNKSMDTVTVEKTATGYILKNVSMCHPTETDGCAPGREWELRETSEVIACTAK